MSPLPEVKPEMAKRLGKKALASFMEYSGQVIARVERYGEVL